MKITNFGGATAILEHCGKRMLFDPWLDDGIFHGSWFHYPPLNVGVDDLPRLDYVYISHIHEDHCSAGTIKHINADAEVILMDREPNLVLKYLESHRFHFKKIHLIKPRSPVVIAPDLTVNMLEADPANEMSSLIDSALLLNWDGFRVYNANDCQPYDSCLNYILDNYGRIDLALIPYSGGSGYPACYTNLSADEKRQEKDRILEARLANFVRVVKYLEPKFAMPFADQYVVGGARAPLNKYISHPACPGAVAETAMQEGIGHKILLLNSGQSYDFEAGNKIPADAYRHFTEDDRLAYVTSRLQHFKYDHDSINLSPTIPVRRLVEHARARMWTVQRRNGYSSACSIYLEIPESNSRFRICLDGERVIETDCAQKLEQPYIKISCPHTLMVLLLIGHVSWNIADAALFLDYERVPNVYDSRVYAHLNYLRV